MSANIVNPVYRDTVIHLHTVVLLCHVFRVTVTVMLQFVTQKLEDVFAIIIQPAKIVNFVQEDIMEMHVEVGYHVIERLINKTQNFLIVNQNLINS